MPSLDLNFSRKVKIGTEPHDPSTKIHHCKIHGFRAKRQIKQVEFVWNYICVMSLNFWDMEATVSLDFLKKHEKLIGLPGCMLFCCFHIVFGQFWMVFVVFVIFHGFCMFSLFFSFLRFFGLNFNKFQWNPVGSGEVRWIPVKHLFCMNGSQIHPDFNWKTINFYMLPSL